MEDFREEWFFKQHFSKTELDVLWQWCQKTNNCVIYESGGKFSAFHELDAVGKTIDIVTMPTLDSCIVWLERLGFTYKPLLIK